MKFSAKRTKRIRFVALVAVLTAAIGCSFLASAVSGGRVLRYMDRPDLTAPPGTYRTAGTDAADPRGFSLEELPGYDKIAENERLILYLEKDNSSLCVRNKDTGHLWKSKPDAAETDRAPSESFRKTMTGLLTFSYIELTNDASNIIVKQAYTSDEPAEVSREKIFGGVRLLYRFTELNVDLGLDLILDDNAFVAAVPDSSVRENEAGADAVAEAKAELEKSVSLISDACESIKSAVKKNAEYSESKKKAVELKANAILNTLNTVKNQLGTGAVKEDALSNLNLYIKDIVRLTGDMPELEKTLNRISETCDEIAAKTALLTAGRSVGIVSVSVLPYFGHQIAGRSGYVFYPEGTGSISRLDVDHPVTAGGFERDVYGPHGDIPNFDPDNSSHNVRRAALPVFGVKVGDDAFAAVITRGETEAAVSFNPVHAQNRVANVFASFKFRKSTTMVNAGGGHTYVYDTYRTKNDREIRYEFLSGDSANYSGMAGVYRTYLERNGLLRRSKLFDRDEMPLGVTFVMGRYVSDRLSDRNFRKLTTFDDVRAFLDRARQRGMNHLLVNLSGWTAADENGIQPDSEPLSALGGAGQLRALGRFAEEGGAVLCLERTFLWADSKRLSFAGSRIASVKAKSQMTRNFYQFRALNPVYVRNRFVRDDLGRLKSWGAGGVTFSDITAPYYDYNRYAPADRFDTAALFAEMAEQTARELGTVAVKQIPSAYLLATADWALSLNTESSVHLFTDAQVPFYQMVIHGSVVYGGDTFNRLPDRERRFLKNLEYGNIPYYRLTQDEPSEVRNAGVKNIDTSETAAWEERMAKDYEEAAAVYGDAWKSRMISHETVKQDLVRVVYENGTTLYFNYGNEAQTVDDVTVPPMGYAAKRAGR